MTAEGMKFDQGKLRWDLIPMDCVEDVVKILTFGAQKYAPNNWQIVPDAKERYWAALMRHLVAYRKGELIDQESDESHLSHAACCLMFLMWFTKHEQKDETEVR